MRHFPYCRPLVYLFVAAAAGLAQSQQFTQPQTSVFPPQPGVVLLQNGQVISGEITKSGDYYSVLVERGEVRLHSREVEQVCRTLHEAYAHRRARTSGNSVRDHLELSQWCERVGLIEEAVGELKEASALNPAHPMIPLVDRRIRMALERKSEPAGPQAPGGQVGAGPSAEELDRLVRGMPARAVEIFSQSIQPMLINNCSASGCHGPSAESGFRLLRISASQPPSRRLTQRNLYNVVQQINRENVEGSPLLTAPTRPHGPARAVLFTDRYCAQFQQLLTWSYLVAQGEPPATDPQAVVPATHEESQQPEEPVTRAEHAEPSEADAATGPPSPFGTFPSMEPVDAGEASDPNAPQLPDDPGRSRPTRNGTPDVKRGGLPPEFVPADPFDPEIFNRQFFRQNKRKEQPAKFPE